MAVLLPSCDNQTTEQPEPNPPSSLFNLLPADQDTVSYADIRLIWECPGSSEFDLNYEIFFGTEPNPPLLADNIISSYYDLDSLDYLTTYYWHVKAVLDGQTILNGNIWSFTTDYPFDLPPEQPTNPDPGDGAFDLPTEVTLRWECSDPDDDIIWYDLYLGTDTLPPCIATNLYEPQFDVDSLDYSTTYYWRVVAHDAELYSFGPLWRFETEIETGIFLLNTIELNGSARDIHITDHTAVTASYYTGMHLVDIANPLWPELLSTTDTPMFAVGAMESGGRVYIADGWGGLQIIDIGNPFAPSIIGSHPSMGYTSDLDIDGGYAYLADGVAGLEVVDISDPANILSVYSYSQISYAQTVRSIGDYIYLAAGASGILIFDQSDMMNIMLIDSLYTIAYTRDIEVIGSLAYIAIGSGGILTVDVTDPGSPVIIGNCDTPGTALGCTILDNLCFVACDSYGIAVINITDPYAPFLDSFNESGGSVYAVDTDGTYIYTACGNAGILVYDYIE